MWNKTSSLVVACVLCAESQMAHSASTTATMNVSLTVTSVCSVNSSDLVFPGLQTGKSDSVSTTSIFTVNCSRGAVYAIELDSGQNVFDLWRRMRRGASSDYINYNLYSDSHHSIPWTKNGGFQGTGAIQTITTYGAIPSAQQIFDAGNYTDQITATVTY